jgi:RNA polymerase sigma-70 factor (ECF subfamily)
LSGAGSLSAGSPRDATRKDLEAWVLATLPRALGYAASLLRDRSLADDIVHDCYLRLLQKAETYDLLRDGTKLLYTAITHACIDENGRRRIVLSLSGTAGQKNLDASLEDAAETSPLQVAMRKELEATVDDKLGELPLPQRAALELKSMGYSLEEIGQALETSPSNAGVLVHRARKALADGLATYMGPNRDERSRGSAR